MRALAIVLIAVVSLAGVEKSPQALKVEKAAAEFVKAVQELSDSIPRPGYGELVNEADWGRAAKALPNQPAVAAFFAALDRVLAMSGPEVGRVQQNESEPRVARCTAALRLCTDSELPLVGIFIGQAFLLGYVTQSSVRREVENGFGNVVRTEWLRRATFAAEFLTPRLTIPAIRDACNDGSRGLKLVARILLQARFAVRVTIPPKVVAEWQKLAAD